MHYAAYAENDRYWPMAKKFVFSFCKMFENVRYFADMHSEFAKFADFYVNIKFVDIQTECYSKIAMTPSQRGRCILLSVVFTPSPPGPHGSVWVITVISLLFTNDGRGFVGPQKEEDRGPLSIQYSLPFHLPNHCRVACIYMYLGTR
jgi:hypothetical protein